MRNRLTAGVALALLASVLTFAQAPLWEEDLDVSRPYRENSYREYLRYAENLKNTEHTESLRRGFLARIGYPAPGFTSAGAMRLEEAGEDSIATYYRSWVRVAVDMEVYGLYLVPKKAKLPAPLVISQHGGGGFPELALFRGGSNYHDMIRGAAREGYVVWAPSLVMFPYRDRDTATPIPAEVRAQLDENLRARGTSLMGVETMRITRALDSLLQRPEVDPRRVGMIGLSYGGFFTLYAMSVDPRIRVGVASCSFRERSANTGNPPEGRPVDAAVEDLVAMIAPRPLQVQSGINDKGMPIEGARRAAAEARVHYGKQAASFDFAEFEGGHEWRGDIAWNFLRKHL